MFAAIAAADDPDALAGGCCEFLDHGGRDRLLACAFPQRLGAVGVGLGLVADGLQAGETFLQCRVVQVGNAAFDGVVEALEPQIGLGGALVQFGNVLAAAFGALLASVEHRGQHFFQSLRFKQAVFDMAGDKVVQLLHRDGAALTAGLALTGFYRACVVAIAAALAGAQRHRAAAVGTEANAGKESGAADNAGGRDLGVAGAQMGLHGVEGGLINERGHFDGDYLADRLQFLRFAAFVELVAANVDRAGQDAVNLADAPAPAVTRKNALAVEVRRDVLHAHLAGCSIPLQGKPVDQPHRVGVQRIDFQLLLDLRAALLGRDDAVADRRQGAVPKALSRVFLQGAQHMLGIFLRLVLVK